ncbi:MAG: TIGR03545 family protein [Elusimicrobiales bacterium]|nr:TIGR03545 family protein [Elusimicrobiales bacterium]
MIRWSYLIPRVVFVLIVYLFFYFAFDPLIKWTMIKSLESVFEAKAEIKKVKTSFINPSIEIEELKVGNKNKEFNNLFEFKKLKFALLSKPLFEKKFVIDEASVKGLSFDTPRKTSCKIKIKKTEMPEFVKNYMAKAQDFAVDRLGEIKTDAISDIKLEVSELKSVSLLKEIEEKYNSDYKNIEEKIDFKKYDERLKNIEKKFEDVKKEKNFIKQTKQASELKKEIDKFYKDFKKDKEEVSNLLNEVKDYYKSLDQARKEDMDRIMSLAKIPKIDSESVSRMLLGSDTVNKINDYYSMALEAKRYIPDNPKKKVFEEKRKRGRVINFTKYDSYPKFLLKIAHIDGVLTPQNPIEYSATVENLTTQPSVYTYPLKIKLFGKKDKSEISTNSSIDLSTDMVKSVTDLKYTGVKVSNIVYGKDKLKIEIPSSYLDTFVNIKTSGSDIDGRIKSVFRDMELKPYVAITKLDRLNKTIENSLSQLKTFSIDITLSGKLKSPSLSFKTDLAEIISGSLENAFKKEIEKAKAEIREKIDLEINKNKQKIDSLIKAKQSELKEKIKYESDTVTKKLEEIQKSLEKQIKF